MMVRLIQFCLFAGLLPVWGCQSPLFNRREQFGERTGRESFETPFSFSNDDPAGLGNGHGAFALRGSEPGRRDGDELQQARRSDASLERLLKRGYDADAHGRVLEAKHAYEQVLSEQPNHPEAHHRLAILADRAGEYSAAEKHYRIALRGKPTDADLLNDLGYSYFLQGRARESQLCLERALDVDPKHPHVEENLSLLSDPVRAERVLSNLMPPRQAQTTLARLFPNDPGGADSAADFARQPRRPANLSADTGKQTAQLTPDNLDSLQEKMELTRLQNLTDRRHREPSLRSESAASIAGARAGLPNYPRQSPTETEVRVVPRPFPKAEITDAFVAAGQADRNQDPQPRPAGMTANRSSQVPPSAVINAEWNTLDQQPQPPEWNAGNQKAEAPEWNTLPQAWPQTSPAVSASASSPSGIEQASFTHDVPNRAKTAAAQSAAEKAAQIGMAAGPGAMFPTWQESPPGTPFSEPGPVTPAVPPQSQGSMPSEPAARNVPPEWNQSSPAENFGQR